MNTLESQGENAMVKTQRVRSFAAFRAAPGKTRAVPMLLAASLLAACATTPEPKIETQIVKVEVVRPCIPKTLDLSPVFPDSDEALKKTAGPDDMLQLLAAGRLLRVQTMKEWSAALLACQ